ncbi:MotA/TolQ/ExbB proton channel family protein [Shewanella sp. JM162201]|uniref:MotA/TolQ/ExbB proton channel family protein n=1 Tax=Shewanella jiangmenensis TaxID=2837387 RepID=A0ABS5V1I6_9GAMM|nr:MotA/TolQ/ExbB proton channel family protein [Shewanella jiangmenensis]MBT1443780.1 MotA/TolQ/ExbB proton channel family protein [Shewanella jiangmenensis]
MSNSALRHQSRFMRLAPLAFAFGMIGALMLAQSSAKADEFTAEVRASKAKLEQLEQAQLAERQQLSRRLAAAEAELLELRQQASAVRRAADESAMSLESLKQRGREWQQQADFQRAALARFVAGTALAGQAEPELGALSALLANELPHAAGWRDQPVAMADGKVVTLPVLTLGPVSWYLGSDGAGFAAQSDSGPRAGVEVEADGLQALFDGKPGSVWFDPTLERALARAAERESLPEHVQKGGLWALPILAFGVFALLIALFKAWQLYRLPVVQPLLAERLAHERRAVAGIAGMQRELMDICLHSKHGRERDDKLFAALLGHKQTLEYFLGAIAITAAVSPLLGLLGTVSGMIETFKLMTLFGAGDPQAVSGGISEALVTTELGLIVAIPALLVHALLARRVKTYYGQLEQCAIHLSQLEQPPMAAQLSRHGSDPETPGQQPGKNPFEAAAQPREALA